MARSTDPIATASHLRYRPDIDGLRAVAVGAVVLHHAEAPGFDGGYVGVDIFFVISGYLISKILFQEMRDGRFSIRNFYARRIKRIFPALFTVLVGVLIVGALLMTPDDFENVAESVASTTFFVSNFYFNANSGYFDPSAGSLPLLHTWSLAVEEQFYLIFPLILLVVYRYRPEMLGKIMLAILALSLIAAEITIYRSSDDAFYLIHARAWELLIGASIAYFQGFQIRRRWALEAAAALGGLLIVAAIALYDRETRFPGVAALLPTLGAGLLISVGAQGQTLVGRVLSLKPIVFIGLISYSLYLWHWPILVYLKYFSVFPLSPAQTIVGVGLSVVAATLSWRFVEQPIRRRALATKQLLRGGAVAMAGAAALSLGIILDDGAPGRLSAESRRYVAMMDKTTFFDLYDRKRCFMDYDQNFEDYQLDECAQPVGDRSRVLIWGDSYAAHYYPGLADLLDGADVVVRQYTATSCRPIMIDNERCDQFYANLDDVVAYYRPDVIVIAGSWSSYVDKLGEEEFDRRLQASLRRLAQYDARPLLVGQTPTYPFSLSRLGFMKEEPRSEPELVLRAVPHRAARALLARAAERSGVALYDPYQLCADGGCLAFVNGEPLHWDTGHMTLRGSLYYGAPLAEEVLRLMRE